MTCVHAVFCLWTTCLPCELSIARNCMHKLATKLYCSTVLQSYNIASQGTCCHHINDAIMPDQSQCNSMLLWRGGGGRPAAAAGRALGAAASCCVTARAWLSLATSLVMAMSRTLIAALAWSSRAASRPTHS